MVVWYPLMSAGVAAMTEMGGYYDFCYSINETG